jgi:KDO II ethanolaminephosphotransferase
MPSYGGVVANSYLPSNWISALGLYAWAQVDESSDNKSLMNPAKKFTYERQKISMIPTSSLLSVKRPAGIIWVFSAITVIPRQTGAGENLVAYRGYSCDTATKLSCAACLCVRAGRAITRSVR